MRRFDLLHYHRHDTGLRICLAVFLRFPFEPSPCHVLLVDRTVHDDCRVRRPCQQPPDDALAPRNVALQHGGPLQVFIRNLEILVPRAEF